MPMQETQAGKQDRTAAPARRPRQARRKLQIHPAATAWR